MITDKRITREQAFAWLMRPIKIPNKVTSEMKQTHFLDRITEIGSAIPFLEDDEKKLALEWIDEQKKKYNYLFDGSWLSQKRK